MARRGAVGGRRAYARTTTSVAGLVAPSALAFGPGGGLGDELYLTEGGLAGGRVLRVSPAGGVTLVADGFATLPGLALTGAAPFGPAIFVAEYVTQIIYRLTPVSP